MTNYHQLHASKVTCWLEYLYQTIWNTLVHILVKSAATAHKRVLTFNPEVYEGW